MASLVGKTLGAYHIISELGRGGMAVVYKAYQSKLDRYVALKVLPPQFTFDPEFLQRFEREAKAAAKLKHPHIVTIYDVGEQEGFHYIAMEFVEGVSLVELIRREGALPPVRAANILAQIASALDYAHALGYIHRDVKPSNILVDANDHATLTDFGIVKAAEGTRVTKSGVMVGTPEYMAPEQIRGQGIDARADVYALGVVCYEMLAGRVPFQGDTARVLYGHVNEAPPSLRTLNPRVPLVIEQVVGGALAKDPAQRYAHAGEFANALSAAVSATVSVPLPLVPEAPTRYAPQPPRKPSAMLPILVGAGSAVVLLLLVLVIALNASRGNTTVALAPRATPTATTQPALATAPMAMPTVVPTVSPTIVRTVTPAATATPVVIVVTATPIPSPTASPTPLIPALGEERVIGGAPMVFVPSGEFLMGGVPTEHADADEQPQHSVYLDAFWMDKYEVTNAQYKRCVDVGRCRMPLSTESATRKLYYGNPQYENYPVVTVSWDDARTFCEWAGKRLPTEAEWEKSARGTDGRIYPWGNAFDKSKANVGEGSRGDTTAVGSYPTGASPYGVMDLAGNVWEWVQDWYDPDYYGKSPRNNPVGPPSGTYRTTRGGSWKNWFDWSVIGLKGQLLPNYYYHTVYYYGHSRLRQPLFPDTRFLWLGFRCAQSYPR